MVKQRYVITIKHSIFNYTNDLQDTVILRRVPIKTSFKKNG